MKEIASQASDDPVVVPRSERRKAVRMHFSWWYALLVLFFALGIGAGYLGWASRLKGESAGSGEQTNSHDHAELAARSNSLRGRGRRRPVFVMKRADYHYCIQRLRMPTASVGIMKCGRS